MVKHASPKVLSSNTGCCIGITFLRTPRVGFALSCIPLQPCFLPKNPSRPAVNPSKSSVSAAAPCALALLLGPCPCASALLLPVDLTGCSSASVAHLECTCVKGWPACNMLADMHKCPQNGSLYFSIKFDIFTFSSMLVQEVEKNLNA